MKRKIPVIILTGFLGSGKTTVLLEMLKYCKQKRLKPGILLNEAGNVSVERHLFEEKHVVELLDGCICCSIKDDLINGLQYYLKAENRVDILFIEGTGISNPKEIIRSFMDPNIEGFFAIELIVGVIDSSMYLEYSSRFQSSKEIRELLTDQIVTSTLLVLNKMDLINSQNRERVLKKLYAQLTRKANIVETKYGKIDIHKVFQNKEPLVRNVSPSQEKTLDHEHGSIHHHTQTFQTVKIEDVPTLDKNMLKDWLKALPNNVLRGKGIIGTDNPVQYLQFQYSSNNVEFTYVKSHYRLSPCIILIGIQLNSEELTRSFKLLCNKVE